MFVNFAKEQTDEDLLTDVVVGNANAQLEASPQAAGASSPITQPHTPPQPPGKPPDSTEGKSRKSKPAKGKSKNGKSTGDKSNDTAMTTLSQAEKVEQRSSSHSRKLKAQGGGGTTKNRVEDTSKHPSALFIVNSDTHDSSL